MPSCPSLLPVLSGAEGSVVEGLIRHTTTQADDLLDHGQISLDHALIVIDDFSRVQPYMRHPILILYPFDERFGQFPAIADSNAAAGFDQ